jgi:AcrR family transcriptional regulator
MLQLSLSSTPPAAARLRGRPRRASKLLLEDAAFELFLEQGYSGTTIDEITQRAGVSRNTFFNYFDTKADVFWVDIDRSFSNLRQYLTESNEAHTPVEAIGEAFADCAAELGSGNVPWILSHYETIGKPAEVMDSALTRFNAYNEILRSFISERLQVSPRELLPQVMASTALAAVVSSAIAWGAAGVKRDSLESYLLRALAPLAAGFRHSR